MKVADWLEVVAPGRGAAWDAALAPLSLMPVYREPSGPISDTRRRFLGMEFSARVAGGHVDTARLMAALRPDRTANPPGCMAAALRALDRDVPAAALAAAEALRGARTDLDFLLGVAGEQAVRGKVYVLRPAFREVSGFAALAAEALQAAGVEPAWTSGQCAQAGVAPAFFAYDLVAGAAGGKLYFALDEPVLVARLLRSLHRPWLAERLDAVSASATANPVGRLVVTVRGRGRETVDVTLHAHTERTAVDGVVSEVWAGLSAAASARGATLRPSYVSWTEGAQRSETVYYQVDPG